jgi:protein-S-isoprenylcysteine O-methyltransferase Ste14
MSLTITAPQSARGAIRAGLTLAYAGTAYVLFLCVLLAFVAFVGGLLPRWHGGVPTSPWLAAAVNLALVLGFGLQHSIMARPWFKRMWTRIVPEPIERSTYVLAASAMLGVLIAFWQRLPGTVWAVTEPLPAALLWGVFAFGWLTVLVTTFLIDHFELFGLRQAWAYATGRSMPEATFKTPGVYRLVRHPMQLGFVIAFWAAPVMTLDRLALALLLTGYILTALIFEERDLVAVFGEEYRRYQQRVPRLLPMLWSRKTLQPES